MKDAAQDDRGWLVSGTAAALASSVMLALCGWIENRKPFGPNNGPSQWLWGTPAARRTDFSPRYTLPGYFIHHAMSLMWSRMHHFVFAPRARSQPLQQRVAQGAATAAVACFVDYRLTPRRLQPGFEQQLSRKSLFLVYASFGIAMGLATYCLTRNSGERR